MKDTKVTVIGAPETQLADLTKELKKRGAERIVAMRSSFVNLDPDRNILVFEMTVDELERGMDGLMSHKEGGTSTKELVNFIKKLLSQYVKDDEKLLERLAVEVTLLMAASSLATDIDHALQQAEDKIAGYEEDFKSADPINDLMV